MGEVAHGGQAAHVFNLVVRQGQGVEVGEGGEGINYALLWEIVSRVDVQSQLSSLYKRSSIPSILLQTRIMWLVIFLTY